MSLFRNWAVSPSLHLQLRSLGLGRRRHLFHLLLPLFSDIRQRHPHLLLTVCIHLLQQPALLIFVEGIGIVAVGAVAAAQRYLQRRAYLTSPQIVFRVEKERDSVQSVITNQV